MRSALNKGLLCGFTIAMALLSASSVGAQNSTRSASPPKVKILSVKNEGLLFTDNNAGVSGVDVASSIPVGNRALWLFGDVFLLGPVEAPIQSYVGNVSNCGLWVPLEHGVAPLHHYRFICDTSTQLARQLIPLEHGEANETRLWPSSGWYDAHAHRLYVYYSINKVVGSGAFGFKVEGYGLACASPPDRSLQFTRLHIKSQSSLWWPLDSGAAFGCAVIDDNADPYLYIVGVEDRQGHHYGKLARVLKSRIADLQAYEYFAGYGESPQTPRWSKHVQDAADVEGLKDFPNELSITYNTYLGAYLAVYSEGVFSQRALLCEASKPWGPYRPIGEISTPHRAFENAFCYACKEHPELAEQNGRIIYITYVDSERYWPQLLRVTLQKQTNTP
ncbi:Domain of unknown function (DUF4185) [Chthonomonas calidirosea]|nr:Domain of unknown function (DUF4185) [Chthonomonas calidirosea]